MDTRKARNLERAFSPRSTSFIIYYLLSIIYKRFLLCADTAAAMANSQYS